MVSTNILKSSVYVRLSEILEDDKEILLAQRLFLHLILNADDEGRGRLLYPIIKLEAFITVPNVIIGITDDMLERWLKIIEEDGAIKLYEVGGAKYYQMTGWGYYQRGNWRPKKSNIPTENGVKSEVVEIKNGRNMEMIKELGKVVENLKGKRE